MREHRFKRLKQADRQYQIYALIDPRDNAIRYIGMSDDTEYRFYQHSLNMKVSEQQRHWIKELQQLGLSPIPQILETVEPNVLNIASNREVYWIHEMLSRGQPLLNSSGISRKYPQRNFTRRRSKLRDLRIKAALNISELNRLSGVSRPTIEKAERDEPIRADLASALCRALSEKLGYEVTIESVEIKIL
jgi:DNA-binding XRE family transcriptional regulator